MRIRSRCVEMETDNTQISSAARLTIGGRPNPNSLQLGKNKS